MIVIILLFAGSLIVILTVETNSSSLLLFMNILCKDYRNKVDFNFIGILAKMSDKFKVNGSISNHCDQFGVESYFIIFIFYSFKDKSSLQKYLLVIMYLEQNVFLILLFCFFKDQKTTWQEFCPWSQSCCCNSYCSCLCSTSYFFACIANTAHEEHSFAAFK